MNYLFQPLQTTDQYLRFFEERCKHNKSFIPDYSGYYLGQYEIDAFDLDSLHLGIFPERDLENPIGFARITQSPLATPSFSPSLPKDILELIHEATQPVTSPLPLWENYDICQETIPLSHLGKGNENPIYLEVGRLVVLTEKPSPRMAMNFLSYLLTLPEFLKADYMLASHSFQHHRFYQNYYGVSELLPASYKHGTDMLAARYDLQKSWQNASELNLNLLQICKTIDIDAPVFFKNHELVLPIQITR